MATILGASEEPVHFHDHAGRGAEMAAVGLNEPPEVLLIERRQQRVELKGLVRPATIAFGLVP
jgi:hypothetical protein